MKNKYSTEQNDEKNEKDASGKTAWRCEKCGQIHYGDEPSDKCPHCLSPFAAFNKSARENKT